MTSPELVDSHCHLDFPEFAAELDAVVARAREAGVGRLLTICTRLSKFHEVLAVAERFDRMFCSVGVHPHEAAHEPDIVLDRIVDARQASEGGGDRRSGARLLLRQEPA